MKKDRFIVTYTKKLYDFAGAYNLSKNLLETHNKMLSIFSQMILSFKANTFPNTKTLRRNVETLIDDFERYYNEMVNEEVVESLNSTIYKDIRAIAKRHDGLIKYDEKNEKLIIKPLNSIYEKMLRNLSKGKFIPDLYRTSFVFDDSGGESRIYNAVQEIQQSFMEAKKLTLLYEGEIYLEKEGLSYELNAWVVENILESDAAIPEIYYIYSLELLNPELAHKDPYILFKESLKNVAKRIKHKKLSTYDKNNFLTYKFIKEPYLKYFPHEFFIRKSVSKPNTKFYVVIPSKSVKEVPYKVWSILDNFQYEGGEYYHPEAFPYVIRHPFGLESYEFKLLEGLGYNIKKINAAEYFPPEDFVIIKGNEAGVYHLVTTFEDNFVAYPFIEIHFYGSKMNAYINNHPEKKHSTYEIKRIKRAEKHINKVLENYFEDSAIISKVKSAYVEIFKPLAEKGNLKMFYDPKSSRITYIKQNS